MCIKTLCRALEKEKKEQKKEEGPPKHKKNCGFTHTSSVFFSLSSGPRSKGPLLLWFCVVRKKNGKKMHSEFPRHLTVWCATACRTQKRKSFFEASSHLLRRWDQRKQPQLDDDGNARECKKLSGPFVRGTVSEGQESGVGWWWENHWRAIIVCLLLLLLLVLRSWDAISWWDDDVCEAILNYWSSQLTSFIHRIAQQKYCLRSRALVAVLLFAQFFIKYWWDEQRRR